MLMTVQVMAQQVRVTVNSDNSAVLSNGTLKITVNPKPTIQWRDEWRLEDFK